MKKNKIVALIVLGIILLQIVIPSLADIDWNVVFAEEINTWDISQNGDGSVMATLSDDGTLTISGNGEMKHWRNSYVVAWDSNRKNIKNVIINNGVTSIGNFAFSDCTSLTNITIPNSVTSIGDYAFYGCENLINITIPNSVTSIGNFAFCMCTSLTSINVDSNNEKYMSDNGVLYTKDKNTLIQYPSKKEKTEYIILQGTTSIENYAFHYCTNLTNITIPNSVTSIGDDAFYICTNLINITIPNSVTSIGYRAFYLCKSLTNITIPDGVISIKNQTFYCCESLTRLIIPSSVISIGDYAFHYCTNLTNITIPNSVTSIGDNAFYGCENLINITIPNSVTSIGNDVFNGCISLTSINVDFNNEKYMSDNGVLYTKDKKILIQYPGKKEGTEYLILQGVESIEDYAFWGCGNLTNIIIPNGVTSIGDSAFYRCTSLTNITIPNSVTSIGDYAFWYCNLKNITIPNGVTSIGYSAFYRCTSLTNITIPNSVTSIGDFAFNECTSLTNIAISDSVTSIGDHAFYKCDSLSVLCKSNSYAEQYAKENNIKYVIDDSVPTIKNVTGNEKWTKDKVILIVNAEDSLSGLATEAYSFDNGQTWQKENTKTYTENIQGVIIKVRDAVGNIATQEIETIKIDNQAPTIKNVTGNEKWTKDKVTLTISAEDSLSGLATEAYSFDNGQTWQKENTKTYTENIQGVIIKVRDAVGNIATQEIGTIKIDNQAPTIKSITGNPTQWTKDKVILTVNAEDSLSGLATEAYSFDNGQTWQKENTKTYTENTQGIIIKVRDAVGNVATYKTIDINNILKIEISNYEKITKDNNEYLTKIEANTTIAQLKEKIKTNGTIKVLKGNNEITDTNTLVGTGMQIQIETEKYIAIVKADLNGDGKIGLSDLSNIKFSLIGKKQLSIEAQMAGDINGDEKVSLSDMAKLKMYLVGKANI